MNSFKQWKEAISYNQGLDGQPLAPRTISGSEIQIRTLASNIHNFVNVPTSPVYQYRDQIFKTCELLEKAATIIGDNMPQELRNQII
jgi:hypothetical protein